MKKLVFLAILLMLPVTVFGQSAKAAFQVNEGGASIVSADCAVGWSDIAQVTIHTSNQKDLVLGASLETSLFTQTLVRSKGGNADTSEAEATLKVRVLVDDDEARPGVVTFDRRYQKLMAIFNGYCTDLNGDGIVTYDECDNYEELELVLDTTAAHHFNFLLEDVGTGVHEVTMQGCVATTGTSGNGTWNADATARVGSLTVEEVRLVKDQDVTF